MEFDSSKYLTLIINFINIIKMYVINTSKPNWWLLGTAIIATRPTRGWQAWIFMLLKVPVSKYMKAQVNEIFVRLPRSNGHYLFFYLNYYLQYISEWIVQIYHNFYHNKNLMNLQFLHEIISYLNYINQQLYYTTFLITNWNFEF